MSEKELEWTAQGQEYGRLIQSPRILDTAESKALKDNLRHIRHVYGYPTWEIKKALLNNLGDYDKALADLRTL